MHSNSEYTALAFKCSICMLVHASALIHTAGAVWIN